jgi:AraC-like DNA-binding protein
MHLSEPGPAMADARSWLAALLTRCERLGTTATSSALAWSLAGLKQVVAEGTEPLRPTDCLLIAGVIAQLLEAAMRGTDAVGATPPALVDAHRELVAFIERCAWAAAIPATPETSDPRIDRALRYVREQFRRADLTMNDVARHVGLTRPYLGRMLIQCTGRGFPDHLHELRIRESRRLLVVATLNVKEIASAVGYRDAAQFCRQFKRSCKTSPAVFRRAALTANRSRRGAST